MRTWAVYGEQIFETLKSYHDGRYSAFSQLVRATFDEALSKFPDGTIDLLHIDGTHFYEDVKHDFESWLPKLSQRGVVLFHDINQKDRGFGVYKYWDELKSRYPYFEFAHGHGLGVLGVGPANVQPSNLFAASADPALCQQINGLQSSRIGRCR